MANKKPPTTTSQENPDVGAQYAFMKVHAEAVAKDHVDKLAISLEERITTSLDKASNDAKAEIQIQSDKIRDQVLSALALFAAFFSLISAGTLGLIKAPTPAVILVVIGTLTFSLLIFLSLFFVFLNNRAPSLKMIWPQLVLVVVLSWVLLKAIGISLPFNVF